MQRPLQPAIRQSTRHIRGTRLYKLSEPRTFESIRLLHMGSKRRTGPTTSENTSLSSSVAGWLTTEYPKPLALSRFLDSGEPIEPVYPGLVKGTIGHLGRNFNRPPD